MGRISDCHFQLKPDILWRTITRQSWRLDVYKEGKRKHSITSGDLNNENHILQFSGYPQNISRLNFAKNHGNQSTASYVIVFIDEQINKV